MVFAPAWAIGGGRMPCTSAVFVMVVELPWPLLSQFSALVDIHIRVCCSNCAEGGGGGIVLRSGGRPMTLGGCASVLKEQTPHKCRGQQRSGPLPSAPSTLMRVCPEGEGA